MPTNRRAGLPVDPDLEEETLKVNFDAVYQELFKPALEAAKLQHFRADDEEGAGDIYLRTCWRNSSPRIFF